MSTVLKGLAEEKGLSFPSLTSCTNLSEVLRHGPDAFTLQKLQCRIAQAPVCPPPSRDLQFCTTNTAVLLIHSSLKVHTSIESPHKTVLFCSSTLSGRRRNSTSLRWEEEAQTASIFSCSPLVKQRCHGASTPSALGNERGDGTGENKVDNAVQKTKLIVWRLSHHNSSI